MSFQTTLKHNADVYRKRAEELERRAEALEEHGPNLVGQGPKFQKVLFKKLQDEEKVGEIRRVIPGYENGHHIQTCTVDSSTSHSYFNHPESH